MYHRNSLIKFISTRYETKVKVEGVAKTDFGKFFLVDGTSWRDSPGGGFLVNGTSTLGEQRTTGSSRNRTKQVRVGR